MINLDNYVIHFEPGQTVYVRHSPNTVERFVIYQCHLRFHKNGVDLSYEDDDHSIYDEREVYESAELAFLA